MAVFASFYLVRIVRRDVAEGGSFVVQEVLYFAWRAACFWVVQLQGGAGAGAGVGDMVGDRAGERSGGKERGEVFFFGILGEVVGIVDDRSGRGGGMLEMMLL